MRMPPIVRDPDVLAGLLEDAAHFPGGHAAGVVSPHSEGAVAAVLASGAAVLPVGAQSSLTGGGTPMGELLLSTSHFSTIEIRGGRARAGAGVPLRELDRALAARRLY
jgi:D-lactate dehydrogenase (cytochrome)